MQDHYVTGPRGRSICYCDYGPPQGRPVLWCHGGPGSRREPESAAAAAAQAGLRLVGIDRPGYGGSDPQPGRRIADWAADALAVADDLDLDRFYLVGVSTGGAYALATAALAPQRVLGVLTCCAMTDMTWAAEHAPMPANLDIWGSRDRQQAMAVAAQQFGEDGSKMLSSDTAREMLAEADKALLTDPAQAAAFASSLPFAQGLQGYADDRLADAPANGWSDFNTADINCRVLVIHGEDDRIVPVAHAHHTAQTLARCSTLRTYAGHGHLSVISEVVPALMELTGPPNHQQTST